MIERKGSDAATGKVERKEGEKKERARKCEREREGSGAAALDASIRKSEIERGRRRIKAPGKEEAGA